MLLILGEIYHNDKGSFKSKAERMITANYFSFDEGRLEENSGKTDAERTVDRMAVIPFKNQPNMTIAEANEKRQQFAAVMSEPIRPTEFVIGVIGDFIRSDEFRRGTEEIGRLLMRLCNQTIKVGS